MLNNPSDLKILITPDWVYQLRKALYGLKQAPLPWYEKLNSFLISHGYVRGHIDITLFIKKIDSDMIVVNIYVDESKFGSRNQTLFDEFVEIMQKEFEMSLMGQLNYFLGLQIKQTPREFQEGKK